MAIWDGIPKVILDWSKATRDEKRQQLDRVAEYVGACADVIDRIRVQEPPDLNGSCAELASLLRGLMEETNFGNVLSEAELMTLSKLLREAKNRPSYLEHEFLARSRSEQFRVEIEAEDVELQWKAWSAAIEHHTQASFEEPRYRQEILRRLAVIAGELRAAKARLLVAGP